MQADIQQSHIKVATILLGTNDSGPKEMDERHVSLDLYRENIQFIVKTLLKYKVENVLLISPPPIDVESWMNKCLEKYGNMETFRIN